MLVLFTSAIAVGPHVQEDFELMRSRFAGMFSEVMRELTTAEELDEIKRHLRLWNPDLTAKLAAVQTVDDLIDIVRDNCSFTNYSILTVLADHFINHAALDMIRAYTEQRDEYYRRVLAEDFAKVALRQAQSLPSGHITVIIHCLFQVLVSMYSIMFDSGHIHCALGSRRSNTARL